MFVVENRQKAAAVDTAGLRAALDLLPALPSGAPVTVGVILVGQRCIKGLNRRFLKKNSGTDILSFRVSRGYGELIISAETAAAQAAEYGHTTESELIYLVIHGVLHLAGGRDYTPAEYRAMKKTQDGIFKKWKESAKPIS